MWHTQDYNAIIVQCIILDMFFFAGGEKVVKSKVHFLILEHYLDLHTNCELSVKDQSIAYNFGSMPILIMLLNL